MPTPSAPTHADLHTTAHLSGSPPKAGADANKANFLTSQPNNQAVQPARVVRVRADLSKFDIKPTKEKQNDLSRAYAEGRLGEAKLEAVTAAAQAKPLDPHTAPPPHKHSGPTLN